jgi:hypothetical protein
MILVKTPLILLYERGKRGRDFTSPFRKGRLRGFYFRPTRYIISQLLRGEVFEMAEKIEGWVETCDRFVAFLDIMGFKNMVLNHTHKEMLDTLTPFQSIINTIEEIARDGLKNKPLLSNPNKILPLDTIVRPVIFSDSIILVSNGNTEDSLLAIYAYLGAILRRALYNNIPIKGALAYGMQTADFNKSLHFGQPLIDAYELQEGLKLYGVVLHHTTERHIRDIGIFDKMNDKFFFRWKTPIQTLHVNHYLVDFITRHDTDGKLLESIISIYSMVSGIPRLYVDNTIEYIDWLKEKKAK